MKKDEPYKAVGDARSASAQNASHNSSGVGEGSGKQAIEELRNEVLTPLQRDIEKLRDPVVLAAIMHTAATEKENTNRLLKTLIERLDERFGQVEARLEALERKPLAPQEPRPHAEKEVLLPAVDEEILKFVKEKRFASAEEVRRRFNYKGKNAASARLNRMFELGLLAKKQVGRAVMFSAKPT